jgi:FtsX extracellular domain
MRLRTLATATAAAALLSGCGGSSAPAQTTTAPGVRTPPSIAAFLREPVATPSACPSNANGQSDGRSSPWVGHVDVSVFFKTSASPTAIHRVGAALNRSSIVQRTYFESSAEAYAEFQRLYTCSAGVSSSQTPPSYRVVLIPTATIGARDNLVARLLREPAVATASCDPSLPCVNVVQSAHPR